MEITTMTTPAFSGALAYAHNQVDTAPFARFVSGSVAGIGGAAPARRERFGSAVITKSTDVARSALQGGPI